jgi:hypothetical protein
MRLCNKLKLTAGVFVFASFPSHSFGCEPILPLAALLAGSSAGGAFFITQSLWLLVAAIAIKSISFALLEHRLPRKKAILYMLIGNLLSTIPGALIAAFTASVAAFFLAVPIIVWLGILVGRRLASIFGNQRSWLNAGTASAAFIIFFFLSVGLFELAGNALESQHFGTYWAIKFLFVTLVAVTGIAISGVLEEYVIARCAKNSPAASFYTSVFRANYITLGLVLLFAAIRILPGRLHAPHFIVTWIETVRSLSSVTCS